MSLRRVAVAALLPWLALWPALAATASTSVEVTPPPVPVSPATTYVPVGVPIEGGVTAAGGPLLTAPGQYRDVLARGSRTTGFEGQSKYYVVRLRRNDNPFFSVTMVLPPGRSRGAAAQVELSVYDVGETSGCSFSDDDNSYFSDGVTRPLAVAVRVPTVEGAGWPSECPRGGAFIVQVTRTGDVAENQPTPIELGFHLEPPADAAGLPGPAPSASAVPVDVSGPVQKMHAGRSFDNAPELAPGRYQDTVSSGQTRYVRIHLSWGQRLSFQISPATVATNGGSGVESDVLMFNPVRNAVALADGDTSSTFEFGGTSGDLRGTTAYAVRYANRTVTSDSDNSEAVDFCMDGDYYLMLSVGYPDKGTIRVPYTLAVTAIGAAERGPAYRPVAGQGRSNGGGSGSTSTGVLIAIAVAAVVLVGAAAVLVVRQRRRRAAPAHAGPGYAVTQAQRRR